MSFLELMDSLEDDDEASLKLPAKPVPGSADTSRKRVGGVDAATTSEHAPKTQRTEPPQSPVVTEELVNVLTWKSRILQAFASASKTLPAQKRPVNVASICSGLNTHVYGMQDSRPLA